MSIKNHLFLILQVEVENRNYKLLLSGVCGTLPYIGQVLLREVCQGDFKWHCTRGHHINNFESRKGHLTTQTQMHTVSRACGHKHTG